MKRAVYDQAPCPAGVDPENCKGAIMQFLRGYPGACDGVQCYSTFAIDADDDHLSSHKNLKPSMLLS